MNIIYIFAGNYEDSKENNELTNKFIKEYLINFGVIIKIIFLKNQSHNLLRIKYAYENVDYYDPDYFISCSFEYADKYFMDKLLDQELILNDQICHKINFKYSYDLKYSSNIVTANPFGLINEGFIQNIELQPVWDIKTLSSYSLYKGNNDKFKYQNIPKLCEIKQLDENDLELVFDELLCIISKFRNFLIINPLEHKKNNILLDDLIKICLDIDKNILIKKNKNFKFSRKIKYIISKLASDILTYSKIKCSNKDLDKLMSMKYGKKIINRSQQNFFDFNKVKKQVLLELNINEKSIELNDLIDVLYKNKREGYLIETIKSSSSEIDPWNIIVKYISDTKMPLSDFFIKNQSFEQIKDNYGKNVSDLLLIDTNEKYDFCHDNFDYISKLYHGYLFTGIPECYIHEQELSLITNSFSSLLEKILKKNMSKIYFKREDIDKEEIKKYLILAKELENIISIKVKKYSIFFNKLYKENSEEDLMYILSTKNNVISLNKIILFFISQPYLVHNNLLLKCLIKECVCRNAKMMLANKKNRDICYYDILLKLFEVNKSNYEKHTFDLKKIAIKTNIFFMKNFTNCSLYTLISAFNYFKNKDRSIDELTDLYFNNEINMLNTLKNIINFKKLSFDKKTKNIQLALYIYGVKNCFQNTRDNFYLEHSNTYIDTTLRDLTEKYKFNIEKSIKLNKKFQKKEIDRINKSQIYKDYHKNVKIFNYQEISELNENRPKDDQLELLENGLLKHHCCYIDCPHYLEKFFNKKDAHNYSIGKINSRFGLINHFKYDFWSNTYIKSFHRIAKTFHKNTYEEYKKCMYGYYNKDEKYKSIFMNYEHLEELLLFTYNSYNKIENT